MGRRIVPLLALLVLASCGEDEPSDTVTAPDPTDPISPEGVVAVLVEGFNERDVDRVLSLFSHDFEYFCSVGDTLGMVDGGDEFLQCLKRFLTSPHIEEIKMVLQLDPPLPPEPEGDWRMIVYNVFLEATTRLPSGEPLFTQATGTFLLEVRESDRTTETGEALWEIVRWTDRSLGNDVMGCFTDICTWGDA